MTASNARAEYLRGRVMTASPEQLQLMLLDGAVRFVEAAIDAIDARRIEDSYNNLDRAQRVVLALMNGLRREVNPALVDQMVGLYDFVHRRLVVANLTRDRKAAEEALSILRHQRETWVLLLEKLSSPANGTGDAQRGAAQPAASLSIEV